MTAKTLPPDQTRPSTPERALSPDRPPRPADDDDVRPLCLLRCLLISGELLSLTSLSLSLADVLAHGFVLASSAAADDRNDAGETPVPSESVEFLAPVQIPGVLFQGRAIDFLNNKPNPATDTGAADVSGRRKKFVFALGNLPPYRRPSDFRFGEQSIAILTSPGLC